MTFLSPSLYILSYELNYQFGPKEIGKFFQKICYFEIAKPRNDILSFVRNAHQRRLPKEVDDVICEELQKDRELIGNKEIPIWQYNYAAVRDNVLK